MPSRKYKKYITFSVSINKSLEYDKTLAFKSLDSFRCSLSSLADNLSERIQNNKCKDYEYCLEYIKIENSQLIFNCLVQ